MLNKALLRKLILLIEEDSKVTINASKAQFIDHDILETIDDFVASAPDSNIMVEIIDLYGKEKMKKHPEVVILEEATSISNKPYPWVA
jgi:hypothetical protein